MEQFRDNVLKVLGIGQEYEGPERVLMHLLMRSQKFRDEQDPKMVYEYDQVVAFHRVIFSNFGLGVRLLFEHRLADVPPLLMPLPPIPVIICIG